MSNSFQFGIYQKPQSETVAAIVIAVMIGGAGLWGAFEMLKGHDAKKAEDSHSEYVDPRKKDGSFKYPKYHVKRNLDVHSYPIGDGSGWSDNAVWVKNNSELDIEISAIVCTTVDRLGVTQSNYFPITDSKISSALLRSGEGREFPAELYQYYIDNGRRPKIIAASCGVSGFHIRSQ